MKKMIFSAIALVAFSFAGMANEVKEEKAERNCIQEAIDAMNEARTLGLEEADILIVGQIVRTSCAKSKSISAE